MEPQQARGNSASRCSRFALLATAGILLASTAVAANNNIGDCDSVARDLKSLTVDQEALTLGPVDPMAANEDVDFSMPTDQIPLLKTDAVAPVLLLTPRVESILREVFSSEVDTAVAPPEAGNVQRSLPLANDANVTDDLSPVAPDNANSAYVPRFQRHMYRTDI